MIINKILETVVCEQLRTHFKDNNLNYEVQSGFGEKHSCETAFNFVCTKWKEAISDGKEVISAFIDLQRNFETIE